MATKTMAVKFTRVDMSRVTLRQGHTRTGACPMRGKCQCPKRVVQARGKR